MLWAVPAKFDTGEIPEAGTLEELVYETKAYATDGRSVTKRALVYLPYGYDPDKNYNILYLMHGTGDDENYWLQTHVYNKTMLDNMIAPGRDRSPDRSDSHLLCGGRLHGRPGRPDLFLQVGTPGMI